MKDQTKAKHKNCEILDEHDCDIEEELVESIKEANEVTRKLTTELRHTIIMHRKNGKLLRDLNDEISEKRNGRTVITG